MPYRAVRWPPAHRLPTTPLPLIHSIGPRALKAVNLVLERLGFHLLRTGGPPFGPTQLDLGLDGFLRVEPVRGVVQGRRAASSFDVTVLPDDLGQIVPDEFEGASVLEIGPKFGDHTRWIDRALRPSRLVLLDLATDVDHGYLAGLDCPHEIRYENVLTETRLEHEDPFDLVLCAGVLYHNVEQFTLLSKLWRITRPGGMLVLETSTSPLGRAFPGGTALLELRWNSRRSGSYLLPSVQAVLVMLAMTGWNDISWYADYGTIPNAALLTCRRQERRPTSHLGTSFGAA